MAHAVQSSAPYTLLPTCGSKAESASSAYQEKARLQHARQGSVAGIPQPGAKYRRLALWAAFAAGGAGVLALLAGPQLIRPANELQYTSRHKIAYDFETSELPREWSCNPFKEPGRLSVDVENKHNNAWRPYEEECPPSRMMKGLTESIETVGKKPGSFRHRGPMRSHDTTLRQMTIDGVPYFPWFENSTVLLLGDSMERLHLADFCDLVGGETQIIDPKHPASAPTYRKPMPTVLDKNGKETLESIKAKEERRKLEDYWEKSRENSWFITRPWMCDIKEYNATLVSTFMWGMEDMEDVFQSEDFFHGPSTWLQRFQHITLPMLERLAVHTGRPQLLKPDLIEVASGFWDLRGMTEEDFIGAGIPRPYPKDSDLAFGEIGQAREERWVKHATEIIKEVAKAFPGPNGVRDGPPISWRTMHHPKRNNYTPYARVAPLDALARKTVHELRVSSLATHPTFLSNALDSLHRARQRYFPREALEEVETAKRNRLQNDTTDYGFDERLRVNEIGRLLDGQEHHFRDFLHPDVLPGAYVWGEIMLYELKRASERVGRTH
ncbi:uncharacterized protein JCM10292_002691 [Rhodotorula paludigena]|uniref:uncharacterized protein n=1 Tax=Rhodotorula paludigena TaxID=86838 RepID=UPI00317EB143